jgi:hypothetical protein
MNNLSPDALALLNKARTSHDFTIDHSDNLVATGARSIDFSQYRFELSDGRDLLINFSDASFSGFSVVTRQHEEPNDETVLHFEDEEPDPNK